MKKFGSIVAAVACTTLATQAEAQSADCTFWTNPHKHWGLEDRFFKTATTEQVRDCLNAGANPNVRFADSSKKRTSPLIYAAKRGDSAIVDLLLNAGGNEHVYAALFEAATNGHVEIVATLLAAGQNPSVLIDSRVMGNAAIDGHVEVVRALLSAGADPLVATGAIGEAARLGHTEVVMVLLYAGVNPNPSRALRKAAMNGHADVVAVLLNAGTDPNEALGQAAMNGHAEIVALLLDAGANPNGDRAFALTVAAERGHTEAVITLLEAGADPLPALTAGIMKGHVEIVKAALAAGADPLDIQVRIAAARSSYDQIRQMIIDAHIEAYGALPVKLCNSFYSRRASDFRPCLQEAAKLQPLNPETCGSGDTGLGESNFRLCLQVAAESQPLTEELCSAGNLSSGYLRLCREQAAKSR